MTAKTGLDSIIESMASAIRDWESGGDLNALSYHNNNPGNLKFAGQANVTGVDSQGHCIFDTYANGWAALKRQIRAWFLGTSAVAGPSDTFYSLFGHYAEANSGNYAEFVAGKLGVDPNSTLGSLIS